MDYLNLNGMQTFLNKLNEKFLTKADAADTYLVKTGKANKAVEADSAVKDSAGDVISDTYLKKADLNFVETSDGVKIQDSAGKVIYKIPVMK